MKKWILLCICVLFTIGIGGCAEQQPINQPPTDIPATEIVPIASNTPEIMRRTESIPSGAPASIDGRIEDGEWGDAAAFELSDGSLLYLKYAEGALYLAVDGLVPGTVNVGVLKDGDLWILHSSAALGSLVFKPFEDRWELEKNWAWCCRSNSGGSEVEALLAAEGWMSHNQFVGNELQTEYLIQVQEEIIITVTYLFRDGSGAAFWPVDLNEEDLLQFSSPPQVGDRAIFSDDGWVKILVSN
ncbi:MAG: hypothetical protein ABFS17_11190 [Chloroflexota bacterium]